MRITEMNAKDGERKVRIFVSERMKNNDCDDFRPHLGWWYCIKGGVMGMFSLKRPHSGIQLQGKFEDYEMDVFTSSDRIHTKEEFAELLSM